MEHQMATKAKPAVKAPAKPAAKAPAKKASSTALTLWEEEMATAAVAQGATENDTSGFKSISTRSGILSIDDNAVDDNELRVIILASTHENQFYEGDFDPNTPATPVCYAFGDDDSTMAPHADAPDKQNSQCEGCEHNEWGSAEKGKGKACKNVRRLVCITEDALESVEALMEAEARMLKLPVMSVKNWTTYMKRTLEEDVRRPSYGVITRIKVVPDAKSQFKVQFHFEELVEFDQELYDAMKKKAKLAKDSIGNAYPVFEAEEKPARGGKKVIPIKKAAPAAKGAAAKAAAKSAAAKAPAKKAGGKY